VPFDFLVFLSQLGCLLCCGIKHPALDFVALFVKVHFAD
jgi:hypothetical protein